MIQSIDDIREYVKNNDNDLSYFWEDALWDIDTLGSNYDIDFFKRQAKACLEHCEITQEEYNELFGN